MAIFHATAGTMNPEARARIDTWMKRNRLVPPQER
jgi:hypothetical protein